MQCVTLLTSCKDARLLKTAGKIYWNMSQNIWVKGGVGGTNKKKKTTLTKDDIKNE